MKQAQRISFVAVALLAALVAFFAFRTRQPPILPADTEHASFDSAAACDLCHGPQEGAPKSPNHPLGNECLRCHGLPR